MILVIMSANISKIRQRGDNMNSDDIFEYVEFRNELTDEENDVLNKIHNIEF